MTFNLNLPILLGGKGYRQIYDILYIYCIYYMSCFVGLVLQLLRGLAGMWQVALWGYFCWQALDLKGFEIDEVQSAHML